MDATLLIASADVPLRRIVKEIATEDHVRTILAETGSEALARLANNPTDVLVVDHSLTDCDSSRLLHEAKRRVPTLATLAVTNSDDDSDKIPLLRSGVDEIVERPLVGRTLRRRLKRLIKRALDHRSLNIVGASTKIQELRNMIRLIGPTTATVLITGESGSGKELVARALHAVSERRDQIFVAVNAASLASSILESELFGHEKGAFTGADKEHHGKFEVASEGTLFLDEIGEVDFNTQVRLLRVLEDRRFSRVGGNQEIETKCRVIAATNKDLDREVDKGTFRQDLYYRLKIIEMRVPPLREHAEDIPILWEHFCLLSAERNGIAYGGTDPQTIRILTSYRWPGNVRELRNAAERAILVSQGNTVDTRALPAELSAPQQGSSPHLPAPIDRSREDMEREAIYQTLVALRAEIAEIKTMLLKMQGGVQAPLQAVGPFSSGGSIDAVSREPGPILIPDEDNYSSLDEMEAQMIQRALFDFDGNRKKAARALGISERTLYRKLKELSINPRQRP
jgi:DNA-binding NtrC family response regulator